MKFCGILFIVTLLATSTVGSDEFGSEPGFDCSFFKNCQTCVAACVWCPVDKTCMEKPKNEGDSDNSGNTGNSDSSDSGNTNKRLDPNNGVVCENKLIFDIFGCQADNGQDSCGGCGEGQFCFERTNGQSQCVCQPCHSVDSTSGDVERCEYDCNDENEFCDMINGDFDAECKCDGLRGFFENAAGACVSKACGDLDFGCGEHAKCEDNVCECEEGFESKQDFPVSDGYSCFKRLGCEDYCEDPNAECLDNDACVCKDGYFRNGTTYSACVEVDTTVPDFQYDDCDSQDCRKCLDSPQCGFCPNSGLCYNVLMDTDDVSKNCFAQPFEFKRQCDCDVANCPEDAFCNEKGSCSCLPGLHWYDGKCIDQQDVCFHMECNQETQYCQIFDFSVETADGKIHNVTDARCLCKQNYVMTPEGNCRVAPVQFPCNPDVSGAAETENDCSCNADGCCFWPLIYNIATENCEFYCEEYSKETEVDTFAQRPNQCPCLDGQVRDLVTDYCDYPCEDGIPPRGLKCFYDEDCPEGYVPNFDFDDDQSLPCLYECPNNFELVEHPDDCNCNADENLECPCPDGKVRAFGVVTEAGFLAPCVEPCDDGNFPVVKEDGSVECPVQNENKCPPGEEPIKITEDLIQYADLDFDVDLDSDYQTYVCGKFCPADGSIAFSGTKCPESDCPNNKVRDEIRGVCVNPCSNGQAPRDGACPTFCDPRDKFCCDSSVFDCPKRPCPTNTVREGFNRTCIEPCEDNLPRDADGNCFSSGNCGKYRIDFNGVCKFACPEGLFVEDLNECCPLGRFYNPVHMTCMCKDGKFPFSDGTCEFDNFCFGFECDKDYFIDDDGTMINICPFPLLPKDFDYLPTTESEEIVTIKPEDNDNSGNNNDKRLAPSDNDDSTGSDDQFIPETDCVCPNEDEFPYPYDGRRCGYDNCPSGLVFSKVSNECVCPSTGSRPVKRINQLTGESFHYCACNPSNSNGCPLIKENCEFFPNFIGCKCLFNLESVSAEKQHLCEQFKTETDCISNFGSVDCFCINNPEAESCLRGDTCSMLGNCVSGLNCTFDALLEEECTFEEYCKNLGKDDEACKCFKNGACNLNGQEAGNGVDLATALNSENLNCTSAEIEDTANVPCYCKYHKFDFKHCCCVVDPSNPDCRCNDAAGTSTVFRPNLNQTDVCDIAVQLGIDEEDCERVLEVIQEAGKIKITATENTAGALFDEVGAEIFTEGNFNGGLSLKRKADLLDAPADATIDDTNIRVELDVILSRCAEFVDLNGNGRLDSNENVGKVINFTQLNFDVVVTEQPDYGIVTTTFESNLAPNGYYEVWYVINNGELTTELSGNNEFKARNTEMGFCVKFPFTNGVKKLACELKYLTNEEITEEENKVKFGQNKAQIDFKTKGFMGSTPINVTLSAVRNTTARDLDLLNGLQKPFGWSVWTTEIVFNMYAITSRTLCYDPAITTGQESPSFEAGTVTTGEPTTTTTPTEDPSSASSLFISIFFTAMVAFATLFI